MKGQMICRTRNYLSKEKFLGPDEESADSMKPGGFGTGSFWPNFWGGLIKP